IFLSWASKPDLLTHNAGSITASCYYSYYIILALIIISVYQHLALLKPSIVPNHWKAASPN
ncbi:hypothetical protein, partial [Legionella pneumophila]|uniref:hypothetical protein n=1 Tax=Legionella pneumophila TaxID=446 RepID=UPI000B21FD3D